jgi:hypothetical protein
MKAREDAHQLQERARAAKSYFLDTGKKKGLRFAPKSLFSLVNLGG